jgi:hypothetical protein
MSIFSWQLSGDACKKLDSAVSSSVVEADTSASGGGAGNQRKARIKREPATNNTNTTSAGIFILLIANAMGGTVF